MLLRLMTLTFDLLLQNKWVTRTHRETFYVKFGDPSFVSFFRYRAKKKQTRKQTEVKPYPSTDVAWVIFMIFHVKYTHMNDSIANANFIIIIIIKGTTINLCDQRPADSRAAKWR